MKSRVAAILLTFFLETFGIHKFYLNQKGRGVLYLLFCWILIPLLLSIIDFFSLSLMSDEAFKQEIQFSRSAYDPKLLEIEIRLDKHSAHALLDPGLAQSTLKIGH